MTDLDGIDAALGRDALRAGLRWPDADARRAAARAVADAVAALDVETGPRRRRLFAAPLDAAPIALRPLVAARLRAECAMAGVAPGAQPAAGAAR